MSKLSIATRLADELGVGLNKAKRFVEDVGGDRASQVADELGSSGSRSIGDFVRPSTLAVGGIGGGALLWRQQDVETARALAEQSSSYNDAVRSIVESDLPPELKKELINDATNAAENRNDGGGGPSVDLLDGGPMKMILLIVIVSVVLREAIGGGE